jgi:hypothetical protein
VADEHPPASYSSQHASGDFTRVGAFFAPMEILSSDADGGLVRGRNRGRKADERWKNNHIAFLYAGYKRIELLEEIGRLSDRLIHLPVTRHDASPHN